MHVPDFLNVVIEHRHRCLVFAQRRFRFLQSPGEIIAVILHRIIRILRSVKAAMRAVAEPFVHPADDVARHLREKFLPGRLISVHIVFQQLRIVVTHLLEMRHDPALVHRIAMEAARQLVINTAPRHLLQSVNENRAQLFTISLVIARVVTARVVTGLCPVQAGYSPASKLPSTNVLIHNQIERRRMRKFRSTSKSAIHLVKHLPRRFHNRINYRSRYLARRKRLRPRDRALHHLCLLQHLAVLLAISLSNRKQHALETGPPVCVRRREVSPAIKWLAVRSKKRRKRPSTLPRQRGHRDLIPAVNIRTLVAIHLHCDVMLIHNRRHFRIVIRLAIHHMTPMTPDRADIQKHRLVGQPSLRESLLPKLMPLNGLMHSRPQIGRRSAGQSVLRGVRHPPSLSLADKSSQAIHKSSQPIHKSSQPSPSVRAAGSLGFTES